VISNTTPAILIFIRNEKGQFIQLRKYFKQNSTNLAQLDDAEVLVLLKRLVIKKTKQELGRIFKERDPEAAKIVRNIRRTIQSASDIDSFKDKSREYICYSNKNHKHYKHRSENGKNVDDTISASYLRKTQPPIPEKFLLSEYLISFSPRDRVPTCLRKMLEVLKDDERYQNYLPLNMAVRIICSVNAEIAHEKFISLNTNFSPLDELHLKEIENRKNCISKKIKKKIEKHYVKTYKISDAKGLIYHKALAEMLEDICQGNDCDSHFTHLKRNMPQLSQSTYQNQERTIFEYLVRLTKRWYRESLIELL